MEQLDRCLYCGRLGRKRNLRKIPGDDSKHERLYCPRCWPIVYEAHKNMPWNKK